MKYLKLFEGFDTDEYYQKITEEDYLTCQFGEDNSLNPGKGVDFDRKIRANIESLLNKEFNPSYTFMRNGSRNIEVTAMTIRENEYSGTSYPSQKVHIIIQLEDEWFLVREQVDPNREMEARYHWRIGKVESYNYYRCDQVEGLKKLLKDKGIIK